MARVNKVKKNDSSYDIQDNRINSLTVNGFSINNGSDVAIYTPSVAGTAGQVVVSAGANAALTYKAVDATVTQSSTNLITSGGVHSKISGMFTETNITVNI